MGGIADECPNCSGTDYESEMKEVESGGVPYMEETIYCSDCQTEVGGFSDPLV